MKGFMRGVLVGVGVGLLVAPMRGDQMRALLSERFAELRGYLPENSREQFERLRAAGRIKGQRYREQPG